MTTGRPSKLVPFTDTEEARRTAIVSQELMRRIRLKAWKVGMRVLVVDDGGTEDPLWATVVSIADDFRSFEVEWDHNGLCGRQSVTDIGVFQTEDEA